MVWVQTSRTHLDRRSLFPSLVTPLRKSSSLLKYVPQKTINVSLQVILAHPRPRPNRFSSALAATAAFVSPGHVTLRIPGRKLKPQVIILQIINRDQSRGVPYFSDHIKDPNQEKRDSKRRAHERCDCHLVKLAHESSQSKSCMVDACMSKNLCLWFKFHQYAIMFRKDIHRYPWYVKKT